jgi:hypothetical protein
MPANDTCQVDDTRHFIVRTRTRSYLEIAYLAVQLFRASVPHAAIDHHAVISPDEIFVLSHHGLANVLRKVHCAGVEPDHCAGQYFYNWCVSSVSIGEYFQKTYRL